MKPKNYFLQIVKDELEAIKHLIIEQKFFAFLFLLSLVFVVYYLDPSPPKKIKVAGYTSLVESIHNYFEKEGFEIIIVPSEGSIQNAELLANNDSKVDVAFIQGGAIDAELASKIQSLGSIAYEPVWVFYQKSLGGRIKSLKDLSNYRVGVGPQKGGTRPLVRDLFALDGINIEGNPHFKVDSYENNENDFIDGKLDAIIVVTPFVDPSIQKLLRQPNAAILNFELSAAYTKKIPHIEEVILPKASIDIEKMIPPHDTKLIATTTSLAVRKDLNKDLQFLLLIAMKNLNRNPDMLFFSKRQEFPSYIDPTIEASTVALKFYDYGIPEVMRYLPLSVAGFANRFWVFLISFATFIYTISKLNIHLRSKRYNVYQRHGYEKLLEIEKAISKGIDSVPECEKYLLAINKLNELTIADRVPVGNEHHYFEFLNAMELLRTKLDRILATLDSNRTAGDH